MADDLSPAKCILLTVHFASSANIAALHSFTPSKPDTLSPELVLRVLLTYLPESVEPRLYTSYVSEVASRLYLDVDRENIEIDISPVSKLSEEQAQKHVKKLHLLKLKGPDFPPHAPNDELTTFLCHRAHRIDVETGLLNLVPQLIEPFLERNEYLRVWYISVVVPLLRLQVEYYAETEHLPNKSIKDLEQMDSSEAIEFLLAKASQQDGLVQWDQPSTGKQSTVARDVKGIVGPWMYGHTDRKRRKTGHVSLENGPNAVASVSSATRKISLTGVTKDDITGHDWELFYRWLVLRSQDEFPIVTHCIEDWNGPSDVDLGGYDASAPTQIYDEVLEQKLASQYAQAAFAACYSARANSESTIRGAHGILARLAEMLDFVPPPDLATSVESLPHIERHASKLDESQTVADLEPDSLLKPDHPLTTPRMETYMLLQMMVYSAYQFAGLGYPISLVNVAKLHFYSSAEEQLEVLQKVLRHATASGRRKDDNKWNSDRAKLLWLWNWGIESDTTKDEPGAGVLGKIAREHFEEEMLKSIIDTNCFEFASRLYLSGMQSSLPKTRVEDIVIAKTLEAYDGASNGNRTRGRMKTASDIVSAFDQHFAQDNRFRQIKSLIAATHAISFYSLTLQHSVPFQPVSIRVIKDPIELVDKILEQNPRSYTKLDDLIGIGRDLVLAGPQQEAESLHGGGESNVETTKKPEREAERRVTFMGVQAALREDDFETAYSYIVNRLTPSGSEIAALDPRPETPTHKRQASTSSTQRQQEMEDDFSWRAAFLAGRYRPATTTTTPPTLRRLEQRTELLALALLLAPQSMLTEILSVWRRCEEETMALQLSQQQAEEEFDDNADKRGSRVLPGNFTVGGEQPELILNQKRREMGRMGSKRWGEDEAPLSMFDLTRSAAQVFSRSAFPLGSSGVSRTSAEQPRASMEGSMEASVDSLGSDGMQRVRKRDMVANAASGALASGLGWVLGARPPETRLDGDE